MNPDELKRNNLLLDRNKNIIVVDKISGDFIKERSSHIPNTYNASDLFGIDITEQILVKCGFLCKEWTNDNYPGRKTYTLNVGKECYFKYDTEFKMLLLLSSYGGDVSVVKQHIKSLHILQNLYFFIADKELEVNL